MSMTPGEELFNLWAEKIERMKREAVAELNRDLFRDDGCISPPAKPVRWYTRWRWRAGGYLLTLWKALKGVELEDPWDWR